MKTIWTFEHGCIWANYADGRRIATWLAIPPFDAIVDLLNVNTALSDFLLSAWLGELSPRLGGKATPAPTTRLDS